MSYTFLQHISEPRCRVPPQQQMKQVGRMEILAGSAVRQVP